MGCMSDPAVEAAARAYGEERGRQQREGVGAAREALKPIRDELDTLAYVTKPPCDFGTLLADLGMRRRSRC